MSGFDGVGELCNAHYVEGDPDTEKILCRFPGEGLPRCHHCGKDIPPRGDNVPHASVSFCNQACDDAWMSEHPIDAKKWIPIEQTLPGGRYDGIWENSGFSLEREPPC